MQYLVEELTQRFAGKDLSGKRILLSTITPVDAIEKATPFGRLVTEQLMTQLTKKGFDVVEARTALGYSIRNGAGEFILSRDKNRLKEEFSADFILAGSYARTTNDILVNTRLIATRSNSVYSGATAQFDLTGDRFLRSVLKKDDPNSVWPGEDERNSVVMIRKKVKSDEDPYADTLNLIIRSMAGSIDNSARGKIAPSATVAVMTFVDVDNMYRSATFGRYITEEMITNLAGAGYKVKEIRVSPDIFTDIRIGELGLTREMSQIVANANADSLLVGTYTKAGDTILVEARLVKADTGIVIGSGSGVIEAGESNKLIAGLLKKEVTTVMPQETVEGY
jgi:TolB-like protein